MDCKAKHTKFQPNAEEWACPKCGAKPTTHELGCIIEDAAEGADDGCDLLHARDTVLCYSCGTGWWGSRFASALAKKRNMIPCPCCKGSGVVQKEDK